MASAASVGRSAAWTAMAIAVTFGATACIGAVDRADFDAAMRARGGGMTTAVVRDAMAALALEYGVTELQVTSVNIGPVETVDVTVRNPARPDQLDSFTFDGRYLSEPTPVPVSAHDDLDAQSFSLGEVPALDRVESLVDDALADTAFDDGQVTGISVNRTEAIRPTVMVESPRSRALVVFDADGAMSGVHPL
ncbi:hypothetical protein [Rhodococcus oryzae]|uniref:hypothetical protein n=1 Tax=Rhodococcus oryzae TaxID=2571143 RepID=UPI0037928094